MAAVADPSRQALAGLRAARRSNRAAEVDVFDAFYQAYLTAVGCGVAVLVGSDAVGDHRVPAATVARVTAHGPAVIGLAVAGAVALGLRSGARGGPLVLPAADVRYVLLAPVRRSVALLGPALRQLRFIAFVGTVAGAGAGVLAARRFPGSLAAWAACCAAAGLFIGLLITGAALTASGRRWNRLQSAVVAAVLLGWAGADVAAGTTTSPTTLIGELALWPLRVRWPALAALVLPLAAATAGVMSVGGSSLEAAERRASLASQVRFALTLQDLRTVVLLRRQLTQEHARSRPWLPTPSLRRGRTLVWRRDLRGLARWPLPRVARVVILGAAAGLALVGVWQGTTVLLPVAALALFVVGLDALEPLAQEIDHPDLPASVPRELGTIRLAHVPVSLGAMLVAVVSGWGAALVVGPASVVVPVGAAMIAPATVLATAGAAVSIVMGPPSASDAGLTMPVEAAGIKMVLRVLWAPLLIVLGLTPVLAARSANTRATTPGAAALSAGVFPLLVGATALGWLRYREQAHAALKPPQAPATS